MRKTAKNVLVVRFVKIERFFLDGTAAMKREREERNRKLTRDRALKAYQAMSVDERRIYLWLKRESST